ncbi:MAG: hypothetical protein JWL73_2201 [Actinomycetia bacterium]|nr:hypothetical protein [Actinomycetes bacterium]
MTAPVLYDTRIAHGRTEQVAHHFAYRHTMWLVDLDDLPAAPRGLGALVRFEARDHLGDPRSSIRSNVGRYVAEHGVDVAGGRVLMLANPRSFGYAFNPLTLFWCYAPGGDLRCVLAEVQNTHGERHCYFLELDERGRAGVDKQFYVSPFFAVDGSYELEISPPGDDLRIAVHLRRGPERARVFSATLIGHRRPTTHSVVGAAVRHPLPSWRVMALILWEGARLWLRRIPVVKWSPQRIQEGVR